MLELPTVGVTHRTLLANGAWLRDDHGAESGLPLKREFVDSPIVVPLTGGAAG